MRVSGSKAFAVADKCFEPAGKNSLPPSAAATHTIHYGKIIRQGRSVDEVLLAVLRAPHTFTREDTVEITCHGGLLPAKLVLDTLLENGARLAEPGEFTRRAFLNGRIDLAQAEAVADLIHSRTELALAAANEQLAGKLSQRINELRDEMMQTLAHVEAHIDFPEEDISPDTKEQLLKRLEHGVEFMDELLRTANEGQILRRGIRAAIVGRPNAGKSSLLNQLLGHDRAIVSPIPGTTRDTIEETASIRGLPVVFIDTAGLREARDEIEQEGVRRSPNRWPGPNSFCTCSTISVISFSSAMIGGWVGGEAAVVGLEEGPGQEILVAHGPGGDAAAGPDDHRPRAGGGVVGGRVRRSHENLHKNITWSFPDSA